IKRLFGVFYNNICDFVGVPTKNLKQGFSFTKRTQQVWRRRTQHNVFAVLIGAIWRNSHGD
ncbi:MAG: hypothetical protein ACN2B6_01115, partial [Rickettsiales bacterium]